MMRRLPVGIRKWRVSRCYYLCICILRVGSMTIGRGRSWLERRRSFLCFRSGFLHQSFPSLTLTPLGLILFLSRNKWPQAEKGGSYISCSHTWEGPPLPYRSGTCYSQFISPVFCFTEQQLSLWCPKLLFCVRIKCSIAMSSPLGFSPSSFLPYYPCALGWESIRKILLLLALSSSVFGIFLGLFYKDLLKPNTNVCFLQIH